MSSSSKIGYVEDAADEDAVEGIESTRKYAVSEAPARSPKERPNTGKSRADKRPQPASRSASSSAGAALTDSDCTARSSERRAKDPPAKA
ncbi:hypothetical protein CDD83_3868 [Cordyceps sp. RAO-2017]|nr:hypothetical protein CDD83_3868 [Cordyceps sp. RAO-2017]